jgi:phosphate transport system substrate-binding protein
MNNIRKTAVAALALSILAGQASAATTINGAGATFPYPIYSKWFDVYHRKNPSIQINYQSIGSGGGIRQITERTVDFGATDGPMTDEQQFKVDGSIFHIPTVLGAVVLAYNLPGFTGELRLTGPLIADIFLGKVKNWNDPAIAAANPGVGLPATPVIVVRRSDGSGTTFCFVDYLAKVSPEWKKSVGVGTAVRWPTGIGGKGNEGVTGTVKQMPGAIGYVEAIYAKQNDLPVASVRNAAGKFIAPSQDGMSAAAASAKMPKDFKVSITDAPGEMSYPISTFTWLLVYENTGGEKGKILKDFLGWMITDEAQNMAKDLGYAPLPQNVRMMVKETVGKVR